MSRHGDARRAITLDPHISGEQKEALLRYYDLFRGNSTPTLPADTESLIVDTGELDLAPLAGFFVYWLFDAAGELLYIGKSKCLLARLGLHQRQSVFWPQVARAKYEQLADAKAMDRREASLIRFYQPPYNTVGVNREPTPMEPVRVVPRHPRQPGDSVGIIGPTLAPSPVNTVEAG